jgi:hypothetical protein
MALTSVMVCIMKFVIESHLLMLIMLVMVNVLAVEGILILERVIIQILPRLNVAMRFMMDIFELEQVPQVL